MSKVHECVTCRALATPPVVPRRIDRRSTAGTYGGPRRHRCMTHYVAYRNAQRQKASDARSRKRSGLGEELRQEVLAEQGGRCPCGAGLGGRRLNLSADHDHELAATHAHADEMACELCMWGYLCHHCNREIVGFLARAGRRGNTTRSRDEVAGALEAIADYLRDPPAQRVMARRRGVAA